MRNGGLTHISGTVFVTVELKLEITLELKGITKDSIET